jgi:hypothetical protein
MIEAAYVKSVSYKDDSVEGLWNIRCALLSDKNALTKEYAPIIARPIDSCFKQPPLEGEIVLLTKAPSNLSSKNIQIPEYYYLQTLNIQSSIHHNALIGASDVEAKTNTGNNDYSQTSAGTANNTQTNNSNELGTNFPETDVIRPLQPYEGDVLLEGRFGQSIRFSSTIDKGKDKYADEGDSIGWQKGDGEHGDPIIVIRNGQKTIFKQTPGANKYINENINHDDSSIYLTSNQEVPFSEISKDVIAMNELGLKPDKFTGKQIILSSDRLLFGARENEILMFSQKGIGLSGAQSVTIDSSGGIHLAGGVINLGNKADSDGEPGVLGNTTQERLDAIVELIADICNEITKITVPTGVGPSGNPVNSANFLQYANSDVQKLKQAHPNIKSKLVFINKDVDYNSTSDSIDYKNKSKNT